MKQTKDWLTTINLMNSLKIKLNSIKDRSDATRLEHVVQALLNVVRKLSVEHELQEEIKLVVGKDK